jgi:hypothetical protein
MGAPMAADRATEQEHPQTPHIPIPTFW